jgi:hypothetical protein
MFIPQFVPPIALVWTQVWTPVLQLVVPGLQVVPQGTPAVQGMQAPLPSHTWFMPQAVPPAALVWLQTGAPVPQL